MLLALLSAAGRDRSRGSGRPKDEGEEGGEAVSVTGEERPKAYHGEVAIGVDEGIEVGGIVQLGEAGRSRGGARIRHKDGDVAEGRVRTAAEIGRCGHRRRSDGRATSWEAGARGEDQAAVGSRSYGDR